ncbi:MAG: hypothetical protein V3R41_06190 [Gammaproteobacteria bacterium]
MNFEFPDIADHPLCERIPKNMSGDSIYRTDEDSLNLVKREVQEFGRFNEVEQKIFDAQWIKILNAASLVKGRGVTPGDEDEDWEGIISTKQSTKALANFFEYPIRRLQSTVVKDKPIHAIDRVLQLKDGASRMIVQDFLAQSGVLEVGEYYRGKKLVVVSVTVQISRPSDQHHYQTFNDSPTGSNLLNLHMDPKPGVMKVMIYLNNVAEDNGPFQAIPNSNHWEIDSIQQIFAWGNSTGNYCHTPLHRKVACAFPSFFRRNAIVGRLIPDGSTQSEMLLSKLITYTSEKANVILFDPSYTFHRGGLCNEGERINLQVVMK